MGWLWLAAAIATEVGGTVALRQSAGMTRPWPSATVVVAYVLSFWCLAMTLKHVPLGVAYAVWAAIGTAAIALIGVVVFGESMSPLKLLGIALVIVGVVAINLGGAHA